MFVENRALEVYRAARAERKRKAIAQKIQAEIEARHQAFMVKRMTKVLAMRAKIQYNNPALTERQVSQVAERVLGYR